MSFVVCCVCVQICRERWKWEVDVSERKGLVESVCRFLTTELNKNVHNT